MANHLDFEVGDQVSTDPSGRSVIRGEVVGSGYSVRHADGVLYIRGKNGHTLPFVATRFKREDEWSAQATDD